MDKNTAIYALTGKGAELAGQLAQRINADCFVLRRYAGEDNIPFDSLSELIAENFAVYEGHVFISASGIAVRTIAPHLKSKAEDPAVVVLDQSGQFAISLLSGHLGGANELARLIGDKIGATAVVTTATDCAGVPSIDLMARDTGMVIGDISLIKHINSCLLDGQKVPVYDPDGFFDLGGYDEYFYLVDNIDDLSEERCAVIVDWRIHYVAGHVLPLYPRCLALGIGCRRGVPAMEIIELIRSVFAEHGVAAESVYCMGSIDAKMDELGLVEAAEILGLDLSFFTAAELDEIDIANPSGMVMKHMGVGGVCEAAAMKLANATEILIPKTKSARVTAALAKVVSG